ncbi:TonB-dependent receptor [Aquimarina agarivorans]|uniref:TonB-dependent receptor n=1 Tax=Aquimarina agarivorans TaxID=980584 RepID=UPI00031D28DD|nr:TonB-dependent receptor plug domain-containing protein [Aquimarina agarivorans]
MKKINFLLIALICSAFGMLGQVEITGTVTDNLGNLLPEADVFEKGTTNGTTTNFDGFFKLEVSKGATISVNYIGFEAQEIVVESTSNVKIVLNPDNSLQEVVLVGTRSPKRTVTDTPVAIDIIDVSDVVTKTGKVDITELLQFAAPSFNAQKQSGADGADHITPAALRGLGPDQTLVLINGKRRHQSSLINLFGTRGRGNTGTDLNAIPASAIKRIEVLRDGASAQYGSDAIAGVINIVLKTSTDKLTGEVFYGANDANNDGGFGIPAKEGLDGNTYKATTNYGVALGEKGGFINMTGEYLKKEKPLDLVLILELVLVKPVWIRIMPLSTRKFQLMMKLHFMLLVGLV